jgi:translation initiation factor IF-2
MANKIDKNKKDKESKTQKSKKTESAAVYNKTAKGSSLPTKTQSKSKPPANKKIKTDSKSSDKPYPKIKKQKPQGVSSEISKTAELEKSNKAIVKSKDKTSNQEKPKTQIPETSKPIIETKKTQIVTDKNKKDKEKKKEQIKPPIEIKEQEQGKKESLGYDDFKDKSKEPSKAPIQQTQAPVVKIKIEVNELTNVRELSEKMNQKVGDVLKKLLILGSLATINQRLDADTAILLAGEFGYEAIMSSMYSDEEQEAIEKDDPSKLKPRFPIVTIMGHVDHGKTSLLDTLRKSHIAEKEFGGITQHIGAYKVKTNTGGYITFLDTPGHEAFTAMRSRGAHSTDIVILVVSAADGVMPQTVEAINHAKDAGVPIIVAINKIDLPTADPQKIKQELSAHGLLAEDWGGKTIMVEISAKKQINIDLLLENVLLQSEMMALKANPDRVAEGVVIEAKLDSRKGTVVTLLVNNGTLKVGDMIIVGTTYGKVRAMSDEYGKRIAFASPSSPVEVLGINEPPQSGDKFSVIKDEHQAREISQARKIKVKALSQRPRHHLSLIDISVGKTKNLKIILKADVQGSLGALCDALERMSTAEIDLKIIHRGAGAITESDVSLAIASDALIIGFNLRPDASVEILAESEGVSIHV